MQPLTGLPISPLPNDEIIRDEGGIRILVVRPTSALNQKKRAAKMAHIVSMELETDFGLYHSSDSDLVTAKKHVFLACEGRQAVGFLLLRTSVVRDTAGDQSAKWTAVCVWVAKHYRRRKIATMLLTEAARLVGLPLSALAFQGPFSKEGAALVQAVAPDASVLR